MDETAKYLIHADITADGIVERSDVVGAIFGQTEGLLGDDLDLRDLQQSSKVGRIDVTIDSEAGISRGEVTIATSLDKVETAILAASLETIERVGPCEASFSVENLEDVRRAKRRQVIDRAKELLATAFDEDLMSSTELIEEVRESIRVERITEYEGYPAGPRVATSDAVIVVEGRADVLTLLKYGIKNAIAVEGTSVPDAVADLTRDRTVTAFLDGDRGGDLILRELDQVGEVDYVAVAPEGRSVETLDRHEVHRALREKVPYDVYVSEPEEEVEELETATAATDGSTMPAPDPATPEPTDVAPDTLSGHVESITGSDMARLLDADFSQLVEIPADEAFDAIEAADRVPTIVVIDGTATQRLLDIAAQRGVDQVIARDLGEFTKRPTSVKLRTLDELPAP